MEEVRPVSEWDFYLPVLVVLFGNFLFFFWCQWKKDNSYIDVMWGITFITPLVALLIKRFEDGGPSPDLRSYAVTAIVSIWALRLAVHIAVRHRGEEDFRYQDFRREWTEIGGYWGYLWRAFLIIFMMQGVFSIIVNSPALYVVIYSNSGDAPLSSLDIAGIAIWFIGFSMEWLADDQLRRHLAD